MGGSVLGAGEAAASALVAAEGGEEADLVVTGRWLHERSRTAMSMSQHGVH